MFLSGIIQAILTTIGHLGYWGILIGMAIESSFFPFPSEALLIPAGVLISKGEMGLSLVWMAAFVGSMIGSVFNYLVARYLGRTAVDGLVERYGKFLFLTGKQLKRTDAFFEKHGEITIFVGRLIPLVRQLISLPAGFAEMNFLKFLLFTAIGTGVWDTLLILIGIFFGSSAQPVMKFATAILLVFIFLLLIIYAININRKKRRS